VSLLGLTAGFLLTIRYRKCVDEAASTQSRIMEIDLLGSLRRSDERPVSLNASDEEAGHRDIVAA
jgi:hypothetical protein